MNNRPLVSICCLTFNHEKYINECLNGFIIQKTNFPFEVLIHDDASTDNTANIIRKYESDYPEIIKPIYQSVNQYSKGIRVNTVFNFSRARGKYIALCEGDDYWFDPYKLQKQVDFLEANPEYGLIHSEFDTYYQETGFFLKNTHQKLNVNIQNECSLKYWNLFGKSLATIKTLTVCFRKEYLEKYFELPISTWIIGDFPLFFLIAQQAKIGYLSESTAVYRTVSTGSASNVGKNYANRIPMLKTIVDIRTYFLRNFQLSIKDYTNTLLRDINQLIIYSILTNNYAIVKTYSKSHAELVQKSLFSYIIYNYLKSPQGIQVNIAKTWFKIVLKLQFLIYRLSKPSFLISSIKRKLF